MKENRNGSLPKRGMKRDLHINQLQETDYSFALNTNTEQETGEGLNLTNEPSNYLAVNFPEGYKVIGKRKYLQGNKTFYILTNPETKKSSIGYVDDTLIESFNEDEYVNCSDCEGKNILSTPLEETTQTPTRTYIELINDECHEVGEGLNLDINFPIKFLNIKVEKGQVNLYWNDYRNPPRWLNTTNVGYLYTEVIPCEEDVSTDCIIIDKLLQFPKYGSFKINPEKLEIGGNLKMGLYEFYGAYCDLYGNNISEYFTPTQPIKIFDENNNILSQTELDSYTNFAIKLKIEGLNIKHPYYKIVCVERNNVSGTQSAFLEGIHPTTDDTVLYTSSGSLDDDLYISSGNKRLKKRIDLSELYQIKTKYEKAKGTTAINGQQFMWGMYKKPELNLQPVVNLFGSLLKWQTSVAKEDLYKSAIATSKYVGYMRDEVQPFSFRFWFKDGGYTSTFPIIGRPAFEGDKDTINENNPIRKSLEENTPKCTSTERIEKWQFLNTATQLGICEASDEVETQTITEIITRSCTIPDVATIPQGTTVLQINGDYIDFQTYVNENLEEITDPGSDYYIPEIADYLTDDYPEIHCTPNFQGSCGEHSLIETKITIDSVENETSETIKKCPTDYIKTVPALQCYPYKIDSSTGEPEVDLEFSVGFMGCVDADNCIDVDPYPKVFKRENTFYNDDCNYAADVINNNNPQQAGIGYFHKYYGEELLADLLTTKDVIYSDSDFQNKLHVGAMFWRIEKNNRDSIIFEVTKSTTCEEEDVLAIGTTLRYNFYSNCNSDDPLPISIVTPTDPEDETYCEEYEVPTAGIFDTTEGLLIELDTTNYPDVFYVAIDTPITSENVSSNRSCTEGNPWDCTAGVTVKYRTAPTCGCFSIFTRDIEYSFANVSWDSIILNKYEKYESNCTFEIPLVGDCDPIPSSYGEFAFYQSIEEYPDNPYLFDSSKLIIKEEDLLGLSEEDKQRFESFYTDSLVNETYVLKEETNFTCQPIRHPKFPDNTLVPFMSENTSASFSDSLIYPLGISIDSSVITTMLRVAVNNGFITQKDFDNIESFEILKGDNSVSKSILANGLGYDMYKYNKKGNTYLYPNFPFNDLGRDKLHFSSENRNQLIKHPFDSEKNNRFSFISPDIFLTKPPLPSELKLTGYQLGNCSGRFVDVEDHPKWTILGDKGRSTAEKLAFAESAIEFAIKSAEFITQGGLGHSWFMVGFAGGTNVAGMIASIIAAAAAITAMTLNNFVNYGKYRYQWLQIFRDLGTTYNFGGYNVAHGYYNRFLINDKVYDETNITGESEYLRGLSLKKYMKDGRYSYRDKTVSDTKLFVNNWSREESAFLSVGDYPLHYNDTYITHDNGDLSSEQGSRTILSENDCEIDLDYERNVGSPYFTLKNFVPDQFGKIDSIKWLTTNYKFNINENTNCRTIFGGTVYISRFTWKRKISLFTTTAMGEPDKLAFNYRQYKNIGEPRFFCDYEADSTKDISGVPFPDISSNFEFDCVTNRTGFYLRPPSKIYLYYYGISDFLVESEINCNYRYGKKELKDNFYPSIGDIVGWTQQKNISITEPNTFYYNNIYSLPVSNTPYKTLDGTYDVNRQKIISNQENALIWSEKDSDENSPVDPWLIFKPLNWYEFKADNGKLIELKQIEGGQVLARFEDKQLILNAVDNLADKIIPQTQELGTGGIFSTRPVESNTSDLGYMGSQHHQTLSTPYGHVTVDAKRGKIHITSGNNSETISESVGGQPTYMKNWFREHLPFKILRHFPEVDVDNNYKGLGITMGWDARHDRVFITKKDYLPKNKECLKYREDIGFYADCEEVCTEGLDLVFVIDATASQQRAIDNIKNAITNEILPAIINEFGGDYRLGLLTVLDRRGEGLPLFKILTEMTPQNINVFEAQLNTVTAGGGLGLPEPTDKALEAVLNNTQEIDYNGDVIPSSTTVGAFRTGAAKAVILVTDVVPSGLDDTYQYNDWLNVKSITENYALNGIQIFPFLTSEIEPAPIPPDEINFIVPNVSYVMQYYATETDGAYTFSSLGSDISDGIVAVIEDNITCAPTGEEVPIDFDNTEFFEDVSWTVAFKIGEGWISYYSFKPDYYSFHNDFFQVGYNYGDFAETLWSHTLNNTSTQVFQGVKYPWIVEVPLKNQNANKILKTAEINIEAKRYQNQWDYSEHKDVGFNKMVIYNKTNNSGNLNLVQQKSYKDTNKYPITNGDRTQDVLYTAENGKHYVNYFYNRVKNQDRNIPNWLWDANMINKTVNPQAVSFRGKALLERLKGQQFIMRLIQDKESRYSITLKDVQTKEIITE